MEISKYVDFLVFDAGDKLVEVGAFETVGISILPAVVIIEVNDGTVLHISYDDYLELLDDISK